MNYYNEIDPKAAAWLRELISAKLIPEGKIDERSITEVTASDLDGFTQCHFFAGIAGWSYALQLAGWPSDRPVWTGSCPCQPFSHAGKQLGTNDERHLWPEFARLIGKCKPATVFGEQVASELGREWLNGVFTDLEGMGYAAAGADLCAAGIGAPNIRQRLYWVADASGQQAHPSNSIGFYAKPCRRSSAGRLVQPDGSGRDEGQLTTTSTGHGNTAQSAGGVGGMGYAYRSQEERFRSDSREMVSELQESGGCDYSNPWARYDLLPCADGKARRIEPGTFPLAHGVPGRVGLLRGYGNAINPWIAKAFIEAYLDAREDLAHS